MGTENYTIGRGELFFGRFKAGTKIPDGYVYLGNTPEFNLTPTVEKIEHINSDRGLRDKDKIISVPSNWMGSIAADEITPENIALFFMSDAGAEKVSTAGVTVADFPITGVKAGRTYQVGETTSNPVGASGIVFPGVAVTLFKVTDDSGVPVTFAAGADYILDAERGLLTLIDGGAILDGVNLRVTYTTLARTRSQVRSGSAQLEGALKFITRNPTGEDAVYTMPHVIISANGDMAMKTEEWQQLGLNVEMLTLPPLSAVYRNGIPYAP